MLRINDPVPLFAIQGSHPWMAFALQLITRWLLGVRALVPGFARLIIQPQPGPLTWAQGTVPTLRGPVTVALRQALGPDGLASSFALNATVPGAVNATVCLPLSACGGAVVRVDGVAVDAAILGDYACVVSVLAGPHQFVCPS